MSAGLKIAQQLSCRMVDFFKEKGAKWIAGMVADSNAASRTLLGTLGFEAIKHYQGYYEPGDSYWRYELKLQESA